MLYELDIRMNHANADIICIQETHNTKTEDHQTEHYRYISNAARKITHKENEKGIGGVSILIKRIGRRHRKNNKILKSMHENNHANRNKK